MSDWNSNQASIKEIRRIIQLLFPQVLLVGGYNNRNVRGSSTVKSLHAEGRAADIHLNANNSTELELGNQIFLTFIYYHSYLGIQEIIWNRQIWSHRNQSIRRFNGPSPHTDHVHVGFTRLGSQSAIEVFNILCLIKLQNEKGMSLNLNDVQAEFGELLQSK